MPSEPSKWLDREGAPEAAKELIDLACPTLREVINRGTQIVEMSQRMTAKHEPSEDLPILLSYLHILEMADGIEVLLSKSCVNPTQPLLRSLLEASLSLHYLLSADTKRRCFAWLIAYYRKRQSWYESMSANTARGRQLRKEMEDDSIKFPNKIPEQMLDERIANLEKLFRSKNFVDADKEYQANSGGRREWYSLYGGPKNLRDLAKSLQKLWYYEQLYRRWSKVTHASDVERWVTRGADNGAAFYPLRSPQELTFAASIAIGLILEATRAIAGHYFKLDIGLRDWYVKEIQKRWKHLRSLQVDWGEVEQD